MKNIINFDYLNVACRPLAGQFWFPIAQFSDWEELGLQRMKRMQLLGKHVNTQLDRWGLGLLRILQYIWS